MESFPREINQQPDRAAAQISASSHRTTDLASADILEAADRSPRAGTSQRPSRDRRVFCGRGGSRSTIPFPRFSADRSRNKDSAESRVNSQGQGINEFGAEVPIARARAASHNRVMTSRELANSICERLRSHGHEALLVGGCVRDILLGREAADYDVATDATPAEVMALFPESVAVGAQFGGIAVQRDGLRVEVATFRADVGYSDGRHPDSVVYARTAKEDVQRRDFTINGLLMRHDTGEVLDYVG